MMNDGKATLETRRLGRSNLQVTALGLGGAGFGGTSYGEVTDDEAIETVRAAISGGIRYIDTSPLYGESERRLGLALQGGLRERVVLSTKAGTHPRWRGDYSAEATYRSVENSLRVLGTDHVEVVLVHDPSTLEQALGPAGAFEALEDLKEQKVIRAIGLGVRDHGLLRASDTFGADGRGADLSRLYIAADDSSRRCAATCGGARYGCMNGSPLAMGLLSGDRS